MRTKSVSILAGISVLAILAIAPSAFAESQVTVNISAGAGASPDCSSANNCFDPSTITVSPGTKVEWKNNDKVSHTVTSGSPTDNSTGTIFDSSLISAGKDYSFTFDTPGTYNYFCQVHPWMTGQVIVSASAGASSSTPSATTSSSSASPAMGASSASSPTSTMPSSQPTTPTQTTSSPTSTMSSSQPTAAPVTTAQPTVQSSPSQPVIPADPGQSPAYAAGIGVAAVMSGVGVWTAVRNRK